MEKIVGSFKEKADGAKTISTTGFDIGKLHYVTLKADDRSLYGKKVRRSGSFLSSQFEKTMARSQQLSTDIR